MRWRRHTPTLGATDAQRRAQRRRSEALGLLAFVAIFLAAIAAASLLALAGGCGPHGGLPC